MRHSQQLALEDPTTPFYKELATYAAGSCVLMIGWMWRWMWTKLDGKVDKTELRDLIQEIKDDRKAADESRAGLHEKVTDVALSIARLEGSRRS